MKRVWLIAGLAAALTLSGCTKSNIVKGDDAEPIFETQQGIKLDWNQIGTGLDSEFTDTQDYPIGVSISYSIDEEKHVADLILMVKEGSTPEEAVAYADAVLRSLNGEAAMQDFSITPSTEDSYGGFFDRYTVNLTVLPDGTMSNESLWLVDMAIPAGSGEKVKALEGAKAMETTSAEEMTEDPEEEDLEEIEE